MQGHYTTPFFRTTLVLALIVGGTLFAAALTAGLLSALADRSEPSAPTAMSATTAQADRADLLDGLGATHAVAATTRGFVQPSVGSDRADLVARRGERTAIVGAGAAVDRADRLAGLRVGVDAAALAFDRAEMIERIRNDD